MRITRQRFFVAFPFCANVREVSQILILTHRSDHLHDVRFLRAGSILALAGGQLLAGDLNTASASIAEAYECCETHNFLGMLVALVLLSACAGKAPNGRDRTGDFIINLATNAPASGTTNGGRA